MVADTRPDVVLMHLQMPGVDGVAATRGIAEAGLGTEVVVLTSFSDAERILAALDAGAVGRTPRALTAQLAEPSPKCLPTRARPPAPTIARGPGRCHGQR